MGNSERNVLVRQVEDALYAAKRSHADRQLDQLRRAAASLRQIEGGAQSTRGRYHLNIAEWYIEVLQNNKSPLPRTLGDLYRHHTMRNLELAADAYRAM